MTHIKTQTEWEADMGIKILEYVKSELYMDFTFMDNSLSALVPISSQQVHLWSTDGAYIYYNPANLINLFKKNDRFLVRAYLHTVFHCLYAHLWLRGNRDISLWNISCDIFVERIIDELDKPSTKRILSYMRTCLYNRLGDENVMSPSQIYEFLLKENYSLDELNNEFYTDDHTYWPKDKSDNPSPVEIPNDTQKQWEKRARQLQLSRDRQNSDDNGELNMITSVMAARKNRMNYREFLMRFTRIREELSIDPEEFDLSSYTFGLRLYGNLPLIEPLETRESRKIADFVIVVDTSYSTSGELVKRFLEETFNILSTDNMFFKTCRLHIIQCDDKVRQDIEITSLDEIGKMFDSFELKGGGNTDFRPAFVYINELIENNMLKNVGGVLYFTDGKGTYPSKMPEYKTAFVYLSDYDKDKVPPWAIKFQVDKYMIGEGI